MYRNEREIKTAAAERLRVRQSYSAPVVRELKAWLDKMADSVLPQSALGKAVLYMFGNRSGETDDFVDAICRSYSRKYPSH